MSDVWHDGRGWWYRLPGGIPHGPYPSQDRAEDVAARQRRVRERMNRACTCTAHFAPNPAEHDDDCPGVTR